MSDTYSHTRTTPARSVTVLANDTEETGDRTAKLEVRNFSFYYGTFQALRDVTLSMRECSITAIIGPSGCGKSTLLRAIMLGDQNVYDPTTDPVLLRRRIGMVFQRPNAFAKSIFDNVAYGLHVAGWRDRAQIAERVEQALRQAVLWEEVKDRL